MTEAKPRPLGPEKDHYWLAVSMAKVTGADMQTALETGVIDHQDWANLVQRCRGCAWSGGCKTWMSHQDPSGADVPQSCPNATVFARVLESKTAAE